MSPQLARQFDTLFSRWMLKPEIGYVLDCAALGVFPVVTPPVLQAFRQVPSLARPWPGLAHLLQTRPRARLALPLFCPPGMAPPPYDVWIPKLYSMEVEMLMLEIAPAVVTTRSPLFFCWTNEPPSAWRTSGDSPHVAAARLPRTFPSNAMRGMWALRPGYMLSALATSPPAHPDPTQAGLMRCRCCGVDCTTPEELELHYTAQHPAAITRILQEAPWSEIRVAAALVAHFLLSRPSPLVA
jgi:hypothetical protein